MAHSDHRSHIDQIYHKYHISQKDYIDQYDHIYHITYSLK